MLDNNKDLNHFKLKKWLTLPEAAKYLTRFCGEEITEVDILRSWIDLKLTLSVNFPNTAHVKKVSYMDGGIDSILKTFGLDFDFDLNGDVDLFNVASLAIKDIDEVFKI